MDLPGYKFHALKGDRLGEFAVSITGNWRLTFEFDGELEIVGLDHYKEPESEYEDEYEEDYVGEQVFDHMAANLMASSHKDDTISITSLNLSDKCSVCGLPAAIMQRNQCFDANCGLIK